MKKNLDITKPRCSKQILSVPWPFVIWRFHCISRKNEWHQQTAQSNYKVLLSKAKTTAKLLSVHTQLDSTEWPWVQIYHPIFITFCKKLFKALVLFLLLLLLFWFFWGFFVFFFKGARKKSNEYLNREKQLAIIWCIISIYSIRSLGSE